MLVAVLVGTAFAIRGVPLSAEPEQAQAAAATVTVPEIPFDSDTRFLKYSPDMNLGEVLGIAVSSKGRIVVLNHPGSATSGPLYGNASTQLLEFDANGSAGPLGVRRGGAGNRRSRRGHHALSGAVRGEAFRRSISNRTSGGSA